MKIFKIAAVIFFVFFLTACKEDDTPLDLTQYEPFVNIGFYDTLNQPVETLIEQVQPLGHNPFTFPEPATTFRFPLDINTTMTKFDITISEETGTITVEYLRRVENQINILRFIMENIVVSAHSYDSVKVVCEIPCISNETEIRIYR
jgi:hypothetical protein